MSKTNLLIDLGILSAFLIASVPHLTGTPIHEWLSIAFALVVIVHLLLHWEWIVKVGATYFKNLLQVSRLKFLIDAILLVAMTTLIMSGIIISKSFLATFGIQLNAGFAWKQIHTLSADISLILVGLHFALNWNWIVAMTRKYLISPVRRLFTKKSASPATVSVKIND